MKNVILRPISHQEHHQILYDILYAVDDFCREYGIKYFLAGGSLLGAIRHQGIIPWDDDIDISMIRSDFERFRQLFHAHTPNGYRLWDTETPGYFYPFLKVSRNDTLIRDQYREKSLSTMGIHIDIFPYDGCPGNKEEAIAYFQKLRSQMPGDANWSIYLPHRFNPLHWRCYFNAFRWMKKYGTKDKAQQLFTQLSAHHAEDTLYAACIAWGLYGEGEVQFSSCFLQTELCKFGERMIPIPVGYDAYLRGLYGENYMTPLNLDQQKPHHNLENKIFLRNTNN